MNKKVNCSPSIKYAVHVAEMTLEDIATLWEMSVEEVKQAFEKNALVDSVYCRFLMYAAKNAAPKLEPLGIFECQSNMALPKSMMYESVRGLLNKGVGSKCSCTVAVFFFDMDNLKAVNDQFGHIEGDKAIEATTIFIKGLFRPTDLIFRFGGDEFVVIAPVTNQDSASRFARRVQGQCTQYASDRSTYGLSVGYATGSLTEESISSSLEALIDAADREMYKHKVSKRTMGSEAHV